MLSGGCVVLKNVLFVAVAAAVALGGVGCSKIKSVDSVTSVVVKDIPLENQLQLLEKYKGRHGWTRGTLEDLTERADSPNEPKKKVIPRDTKVTIVDLNLVYSGTVTVDDPKGKRIVAGLECERPLKTENVEKRLSETFWFEDPTIRHVEYIRKWGKKTARSVVNHEVFAGMPAEAAQESWGIPDEVAVNEVGNDKEERCTYREGKRSKKIFIIGGVVGRWEE
jgi:hypothetical protein